VKKHSQSAPGLSDPEADGERPKRSLLARLRLLLPQLIHGPLIGAVRQLRICLQINSGDWHWLEQKPLPLGLLNRSLWRSANPSPNYYTLLFLSSVIATLGLLAGSTAAIIGAMIVAPLMGPITGVAFGISMGNRRLLKRSGFAVLTGALMTIASAYALCKLIGLTTFNAEILSRTRPTLIDLAIALAAGAAGAFAKTRRDVADALPGVAIAVALVPPLSVIGIGLAFGSEPITTGSTILFLTNLAGIILSGGLVFVWQDYGSLERAKRGLIASGVLLAVLGIPLGLSLRDLVIEEKAKTLVNTLIRRQTVTFGNTYIQKLQVESEEDRLVVTLEVAAPVGTITATQVDLVRDFLKQQLQQPVDLNVLIFPTESFSSVSTPSKTE
jgi:uncharacterized hydrophobic protein (TIGR00271 family)